jgi:hypothetical protein
MRWTSIYKKRCSLPVTLSKLDSCKMIEVKDIPTKDFSNVLFSPLIHFLQDDRGKAMKPTNPLSYSKTIRTIN